MRLLFMRHAQCHSNGVGRMLGTLDGSGFAEANDSPDELTALGKNQAQALGAWLARQKMRPTRLLSSPSQRALQTWALLQGAWPGSADLQVLSDRRLLEIDQGIFAGLTWAEAQQRHPQLCDALMRSLDWLPIPAAESPLESRARAASLLATWLDQSNNEDYWAVVSHAGFLSHLVSELLGCDRTWGCAISPTGLFEFELDLPRWSQTRENRFNTALWKINHFNSTQHLQDLA